MQFIIYYAFAATHLAVDHPKSDRTSIDQTLGIRDHSAAQEGRKSGRSRLEADPGASRVPRSNERISSDRQTQHSSHPAFKDDEVKQLCSFG